MRDKSRLETIIKEHFKDPFNKLLLDEIKHSIRLRTTSKKVTKLGQSKLGGAPDLPNKIKWPKIKGEDRHYSFIGQINLNEIQQYDIENQLPNKGLLYFYYDIENWDEGRVIYTNNTEELKRAAFPNDIAQEKRSFLQRLLKMRGKKYIFNECFVEINIEYYSMPEDSIELKRLKQLNCLSKNNELIFNEEVFEKGLLHDEDERNSNHHLLGYYNGIQHNYYQLDLIKEKGKTIEEINKALEWKLLLQLDSDNNLDAMWGDWGKIYFFIHKDDLENLNFNKVKVIGECY